MFATTRIFLRYAYERSIFLIESLLLSSLLWRKGKGLALAGIFPNMKADFWDELFRK